MVESEARRRQVEEFNKAGEKTRFSGEKAVEAGRKGAPKSAEARRRQKAVRNAFKDIFKLDVPNDQLQALLEALGLDPSIYNAMLFSMTNAAVKGNVRAFEAVMKYAGEDKLREAEIKQIADAGKKNGGSGDVEKLIDAMNAGAAIDWADEKEEKKDE